MLKRTPVRPNRGNSSRVARVAVLYNSQTRPPLLPKYLLVCRKTFQSAAHHFQPRCSWNNTSSLSEASFTPDPVRYVAARYRTVFDLFAARTYRTVPFRAVARRAATQCTGSRCERTLRQMIARQQQQQQQQQQQPVQRRRRRCLRRTDGVKVAQL